MSPTARAKARVLAGLLREVALQRVRLGSHEREHLALARALQWRPIEVDAFGIGAREAFGPLQQRFGSVSIRGAQNPDVVARSMVASRSIVFASRWEGSPHADPVLPELRRRGRRNCRAALVAGSGRGCHPRGTATMRSRRAQRRADLRGVAAARFGRGRVPVAVGGVGASPVSWELRQGLGLA